MIADPMANLGGGTPSTMKGQDQNTKEVFDPMIWKTNLERVDRIRAVMGIASGCTAGILGLTGLQGLCKSYFVRDILLR